MHWYKIEVRKGSDGSYHYLGSSEEDPESLVKKAQNGYFVRLNDLLYMDRGTLKEWTEWDNSLVPTVYISGKDIISVMEFKADPREFSTR